MWRLPSLSAVLLLAYGTLVGTATTPVAPATPVAADPVDRYVALGDSFASVGTLTKFRPEPLGCARSSDNYPSVLAARLDVPAFVDMSCGSATTVHMAQKQPVPLGENPPQLDALTRATDLVTLTIGGNDIGFGEIVKTCATRSLDDPLGAPCAAHYGDELTARIAATAPTVAAVLDAVHERSPGADVVLVGYLRMLPPRGGCWPVVPVAVGDVRFLDAMERDLNDMLAGVAREHDATFVDPGRTTGHDVCQPPTTKWVEGIIPTSLSVPVHPNASGQAHVAGLVAAAVSS